MIGLFDTVYYGVIATVVYYIARYLWELLTVGGYEKKAVVVTGCDTGFGRMLALKLTKAGFTVFAGCLTKEGKDSLAKEGASLPGKLFAIPLDITKQESIDAARKFVFDNMPAGVALWALVNNAGVFTCYGPDDWCKVEDYESAFSVNTLGGIRMAHAFKDVIKKNQGRIVAVSSIAGRISAPAMGPYVVSKYGVEAYMDTLRRELWGFGVKVSILEPGVFKGTMLLDHNAQNQRVEKVWSRLSPTLKSEYGEEFKELFKSRWNTTFDEFASTRPEYVVDNYFHAVTARFPRARYHCGWDAILLWIPLIYLPTELEDFIIRKASDKGKPLIPKVLEHIYGKNKDTLKSKKH